MILEKNDRSSVAIVLGCGEVGSAVALGLHGAGLSVVLVDEADPAWHRRGMAFTNAWYIGNAELDGEGACFCASVKSIPSVLARRMIAATTWSWPGVAGALRPVVLVDARGHKRRGSDTLLGRMSMTIGIGPGFFEGENVDVAIALPDVPHCDGGIAGDGLETGIVSDAQPDACWTVEASRHGRFMTERRIGDSVRAGQIVGGLGNEVVRAPAAGVLRGLVARGARIMPGDTLLEIDPGGVAHRCYGVAEGSRRMAADVLTAFAARQGAGRASGSREDRMSAPAR